MAEINDLNVTDASNTARFPENMAPSAVNDGARALEGMVARWHKDTNGSVTVSGTDTYTATINADSGFALYAGFVFVGKFTNANTGASTLNLTPDGGSALGAVAIKKHGATALDANDIPASGIKALIYDGTNFQMVSPASSEVGTLTAADILDEDDFATDSATKAPSQQSAGQYINDTALLQGLTTIFIPVSAMRPTVSNGCSAVTDVETTAGRPDLEVMWFDPSADEHAQFQIAMPKNWNEGTVTARFIWTHSGGQTAGLDGVAFAIQGVFCADDATADVAYGTAVVMTAKDGATAEDVYVSAVTAAVTIAGTPAAGGLTFFRVFRDVSDAGDDLDVDAGLIGVLLFYTTDAGDDT